jgi:hypothetical protein
MAVIDAGLVLDGLYEHRSLPWRMLPHMVEKGLDFMLPEHQRDLVPLTYSLLASKPA